MKVWRIGSNWGKENILPIFKKYSIAFAGEEVEYRMKEVSNGDLVCITNGQSIIAVGKINGLASLKSINDSYAKSYADVTAIKLNPLFFSEDHKIDLGSYDGQGKQFHEAGDSYSAHIINLYKQLNKLNREKDLVSLLEYKKQVILQGPPGTGKTYTAKDIAEKMIFGEVSKDKKKQKEKFENSEKKEQFKIIQFHPAFSYEDFVRGISTENKEGAIEYKTKNKLLAEFARKALENYQDSRKDSQQLTEENWLEESFGEFTEFIIDKIDENDGKLFLPGTTTYLKQVEEDCFRYTGDNWNNNVGNRMHFKDIIEMYRQNINDRQGIKKMKGVSGLAVQHASYFMKILDMFYKFLEGTEKPNLKASEVKEGPYILIIDEINRANLPAVLGELIYALEYRGEKVESMYDIDGDRALVLPPNLYIIGTMNTADRSVGHIDYAIRRRFAFVDIEPSIDIIDDVIKNPALCTAARGLFNKVADLFHEKKNDMDQKTVYLQSDFKAKEVQLGHSYFLADSNEQLGLKLNFEIKPLLTEYVKDGILNEIALNLIEKL